ncbi:spindle pole body [Moniliophthora roreri]|nr:spindle pole body [Moniliophthora roreri]
MEATSADTRVGSGAGVPSTLSNSTVIVLSSCGFRSSSRSVIPDAEITKALVALVRTAALEFCNPVFRKSIRFRNDSPSMPNSVRAELTQVTASAKTFGAFCFDKASYAVQSIITST